MRKLFALVILFTIFHIPLVCLAEQTCNPDYNKIISGVPFCTESPGQSVTTVDPNKINNAVDVQSETYPVIVDFSPYIGGAGPYPPINPLPQGGAPRTENFSRVNPYQNNYSRPFTPGNQQYAPNYQQNIPANPYNSYVNPQPYNNYSQGNMNNYQVVPNNPQDSLPLQIPGQFQNYLNNVNPNFDRNYQAY